MFVLGMHRSGTSLFARMINLAGAALPGDLLPANEDNPKGYWEAREVVGIHNELFLNLDSSWCDDSPLSLEQILSCMDDFSAKALPLLGTWFEKHDSVVIKDPRLARLLPLWLQLLAQSDVEAQAFIVVRNPLEVAASLRKRAEQSEFKPAAILDSAKAFLLWLRYLTDCELHTRSINRTWVSYDDLLNTPITLLTNSLSECKSILQPDEEALARIGDFVDQKLRRNRAEKGTSEAPLAALCSAVYRDLPQHYDNKAYFDGLKNQLNEASSLFAPLRASEIKSPHEQSPWPHKIGATLALRSKLLHCRIPKRLLYVSGAPQSKGHVYRVENAISELRRIGMSVTWLPSDQTSTLLCREAIKAEVVVIFRAEWSNEVSALVSQCKFDNTPIIFDIDDLVFDPYIMTPEYFDYLRMSENSTQVWQQRARSYLQTLRSADYATVTTNRLKEHIEALGIPSMVVKNGIGRDRLERALRLNSDDASRNIDVVRVGYVSGTPTHQRDFSVIIDPLSRLLETHKNVVFTCVGALNLSEFPELSPFLDRIEIRPLVPLNELSSELARFDINLAPLEVNNPFCEAKSELKYFEAGSVGVPTVASSTSTMVNAIVDGVTGFCANDGRQWLERLTTLVAEPELRRVLGRSARQHCIVEYGPEAMSDSIRAALIGLTKQQNC